MSVPGRRDLLCLGLLTGGASLAGLLANALRERPLPLLDADGPGALPAKAERITVEDLCRGLDARRPWLLLDVRKAEAFRAAHAPQAMSAPATSFTEAYQRLGLASLLKAAELTVILCESAACPASDRVAKILADLGHAPLRVLHGGWEAYQRAGRPQVSP